MNKNIELFTVDTAYIEYLSSHEPLLFHNKKKHQTNERKYIGVVLLVNGVKYFAPLSSFKEKHGRMKDAVDFIKIKRYAVINLNTMFPAPDGCYSRVDISKEADPKYRALLLSEYRYIKSIQDRIRKNAAVLYRLKTGNTISRLTNRCVNFIMLEQLCTSYMSDDPFYDERNLRYLEQKMEDYKEGKLHFEQHDLREALINSAPPS